MTDLTLQPLRFLCGTHPSWFRDCGRFPTAWEVSGQITRLPLGLGQIWRGYHQTAVWSLLAAAHSPVGRHHHQAHAKSHSLLMQKVLRFTRENIMMARATNTTHWKVSFPLSPCRWPDRLWGLQPPGSCSKCCRMSLWLQAPNIANQNNHISKSQPLNNISIYMLMCCNKKTTVHLTTCWSKGTFWTHASMW